MSKKKTIYLPLYDEFEDTPWISRNRELNRDTYDWYRQGLEELGQPSEQLYDTIVGRATQSMWDDYNRNYQKAVNQNIARNYGRTGTTQSTAAGYLADNLQRQYNDSAARISGQANQMYNQLLNSNLQRVNLLGNAFNTSGQTTQAVDKANYDIRQQNKDRQWQNDILREKSKTDWIKIMSDAGAAGYKAGLEGMKSGNPWVALGGAIGGTLSGGYASYADPSGQYGYMDDWNNIMGTGSGGGAGGMGSMFGGGSSKSLGSNVSSGSDSQGLGIFGQAAGNLIGGSGAQGISF